MTYAERVSQHVSLLVSTTAPLQCLHLALKVAVDHVHHDVLCRSMAGKPFCLRICVHMVPHGWEQLGNILLLGDTH